MGSIVEEGKKNNKNIVYDCLTKKLYHSYACAIKNVSSTKKCRSPDEINDAQKSLTLLLSGLTAAERFPDHLLPMLSRDQKYDATSSIADEIIPGSINFSPSSFCLNILFLLLLSLSRKAQEVSSHEQGWTSEEG